MHVPSQSHTLTPNVGSSDAPPDRSSVRGGGFLANISEQSLFSPLLVIGFQALVTFERPLPSVRLDIN